MIRLIRRVIKHLVGPFLAFWHTGHFRPFIKKNKGLDKLAGKPLIGWINYHQYHVLGKNTYFLGHRALKNPMDSWVLQEMIFEIKPDVVFEIGNKNGGSTLYYWKRWGMAGCWDWISITAGLPRNMNALI